MAETLLPKTCFRMLCLFVDRLVLVIQLMEINAVNDVGPQE